MKGTWEVNSRVVSKKKK